MTRRNYKVYDVIYLYTYTYRILQTILDTITSPKFISTSDLPILYHGLEKDGKNHNICDANKTSLGLKGTIRLRTQLGQLLVKVEYYVSEKHDASYILGAGFRYWIVDSTHPRLKIVKMNEGNTTLIDRIPRKMKLTAHTLHPELYI